MPDAVGNKVTVIMLKCKILTCNNTEIARRKPSCLLNVTELQTEVQLLRVNVIMSKQRGRKQRQGTFKKQ